MKFRFEYATRSCPDPVSKFVVEAPNVMKALALHPEVLQENVVRLTIHSFIEAEIRYVFAAFTVYYTCVCGTPCECVLGDGESLEQYQTGCCGVAYHIWIEKGEAKLEQVNKYEEPKREVYSGDPFLPDWKDE